jgi:hypothetical protein
VEAQLKQLDRDYEVIKKQHTELLERRESARLSQDVEDTNASDVTFRVVDPPFVPREPSEPNKIALNTMVLVLAAGVGGGCGTAAVAAESDCRGCAHAGGRRRGCPCSALSPGTRIAAASASDFWRLAFFSSVSAFLVIAFVAVLVAPTLLEKFA